MRCVATSKARIDLQRVAEEIEPQRLRTARRIKIEDAAAHGEFADIAHGRHALEAGVFEPADQRVHVDLVAGPGLEGLRLDHCGRRNALEQRVGGGQNDRAVRVLAKRNHRRQRVEPACRGIRAGRDAVVGQAVPGWKLEHRQLGRGKGERLGNGRQALAVARDEKQRPVGANLSGKCRKREGLVAVGDAVDDETAGPPFRQADGIDKAHDAGLRVYLPAECQNPEKYVGALGFRDRPLSGDPGQKLGVGHFEKPFILVEFGLGQGADLSVGEVPRIRSISRMPRCHERNSSLRRRASSPSLDRIVPVISAFPVKEAAHIAWIARDVSLATIVAAPNLRSMPSLTVTPLWPAGHLPLKGGDQQSAPISPTICLAGQTGGPKLQISPLEGEMAGRPEGGEWSAADGCRLPSDRRTRFPCAFCFRR